MQVFRNTNKFFGLVLLAALFSGTGCNPEFSNDADILFAFRGSNQLDFNALGQRIAPETAITEFVEAPKALLLAGRSAWYSSIGDVRLYALLDDDSVLPLRIYPPGPHIRLHDMIQTKDFILLHYKGLSIACPLVLIRKADYKVTCAWSAADYAGEFGTDYPGNPEFPFLETHALMIRSVIQYDDVLLMAAGRGAYRLAFDEAPVRVTAPGNLDEENRPPGEVHVVKAFVNRTGDIVQEVNIGARFQNNRYVYLNDSVTGESRYVLGPRNFAPSVLSYNARSDVLFALDSLEPEAGKSYRSWKRVNGVLRRRFISMTDDAPFGDRYGAGMHTHCGRAGKMYMPAGPVAADGGMPLAEIGTRRGRIFQVSGLPVFSEGLVHAMTCGGSRLFLRFRARSGYPQAIYHMNIRRTRMREVLTTHSFSIIGMAAVSGRKLLITASESAGFTYFLAEVNRNGEIRRLATGDVGSAVAIMPLYNMPAPNSKPGAAGTVQGLSSPFAFGD